MLKYSVFKKEDNILDTVIQKTGGTVEFTLAEIEQSLNAGKKMLKEITAKKELSEATIINIENFHPEVKQFNAEQLIAFYMHRQNTGIVSEANKKIEELKLAIEETEQAKRDIKEQLGLCVDDETKEPTKEETIAEQFKPIN